MFAMIGMLVVLLAVIGGFLMEHGPLRVLMQPSELVIIGGASLGTLLIANPLHTLKGIVSGMKLVISGSRFNQARYLDALKMMYDLFCKIRHEGPGSVESDIEAPQESKFFQNYPNFLKDHETRDFICDTMRMALMGGVEAFDVDQMVESDMEVHAHERSEPAWALSSMADALPGMGIVAAVLGVVMTMSALGGPPEEIGKKVAAALVGTFLGILLCYGFIGPTAANLVKLTGEERAYWQVLRVTMIAFMKGTSPLLATEMGRRAVPAHLRPSFQDFEKKCKERPGQPATTAGDVNAAGAAAPAPASA